MHRFVLASLLLLISCTLHAQTFSASISREDLFTSVNGAPSSDVDLRFDFLFNSADVLPGQGHRNGDLYPGLNYTVTSTDLGLDRVAATNLLDLVLNFEPAGGTSTNDGFVLFNGDTGLFSGAFNFGGALNAFDGQSSLLVTGGTGSTSGIGFGTAGFQTALGDGTTFGVQFGTGVTTVAFTVVPEPSSLMLLMTAVGGVFCYRRKSSVVT